MAKRSVTAEVEQEEKIEKAPPPKAVKTQKDPTVKTERELKWAEAKKSYEKEKVITLLVDYNPKRAGTKTYDRFESYEDGMTVEEALKAGFTMDDLAWAAHKGEIKIADEFDEDAEKRSAPPAKAKAKPKKEAVKESNEEEEETEEEEEEEEEEVEAPAKRKRSAKK